MGLSKQMEVYSDLNGKFVTLDVNVYKNQRFSVFYDNYRNIYKEHMRVVLLNSEGREERHKFTSAKEEYFWRDMKELVG